MSSIHGHSILSMLKQCCNWPSPPINSNDINSSLESNIFRLEKMKICKPILLLTSPTLFLGLLLCINAENDLDYFRLLDDRLMYRIEYKSADDFPHELEDAKERLVQITSSDQEQYQCIIPAVSSYSKKRIESYTGPTPAQLLAPIYSENICSYKFESYWNYEVCHGRYVMQYHEEKETKKRTEYFLGNYVGVSAAVEARNFDQLSPPMKKVGEEMRAYYPVTYTHGTVCDITGKPRQTAVLYVCDDEARQNIYSFTEISSCQYEIIVLSSELCAHPAFQVIPHKEHEISCFPMNKESDENPKPRSLLKIEDETENQYMQEYGLFKEFTSAKSAKQIFSKLFQVEEEIVDDGFNQLNAILESIKKVAQQRSGGNGESLSKPVGKHSLASKEQQQLQSPPTEMQRIIQGFWAGHICLHGGTGWWKYEVCYGKSVKQYHQETGKPREDIVLGMFDQAVHKAWATEYPEKAVERKLDGKVTQVTNLYTKGDICIESGAHRSCEVHLRCREDIVAQKVFIYMLEPSTCQYIVVLESRLFCDVLQKVDKYGLLPEDASGGGEKILEEEKGKSPVDDEEKQLHFSKITIEDGDKEQRNEDGTMKKIRKAKLEIGSLALNQEEIMRILHNLMEGIDAGEGGAQVLVDVTKIKIGGTDEEETSVDEENSEDVKDTGAEPTKESGMSLSVGEKPNEEGGTERSAQQEDDAGDKKRQGGAAGEL